MQSSYTLTTGFNRTKPTVLVAEDSPEIQRYLRRLLELDGYRVEVASSGEEALQLMGAGSAASLAVLDWQMPGIDGLETLQRLRELRPGLKVIMCSGVDDPDRIREAVLAGADAYVVKPVRHLYLSAAVQHCLAGDVAEPTPPLPKTRTMALVPPSFLPS